MVKQKLIRDNTDVYAYLMSKPSVLQRLNHHVTSGKGKVLDLSRDASDGGFSHFAGLPATTMSAKIVSHMQYFVNPDGQYMCVYCSSVKHLFLVYLCICVCACACMCVRVCMCVCVCVCACM